MNFILYAFKKPSWFNHPHQSLTTTSSILLILLFLCIIRHHILTSTLPLCTVVRIFIQRWITIVSVYFSPSHPIDFDNLHDLISQLPSPLMIVGHFNCRHLLWGDSVVNSHGCSLERYLSTSNLSILNSHRPTHFDTRTILFLRFILMYLSPQSVFSLVSSRPFSYLTLTSYVPIPNTPCWCFKRSD